MADDAGSITDYIEANGDRSELFDAPSLFYLTHADSIRRWSKLSTNARAATCAYLEVLGEDLEGTLDPGTWQMTVADTGRSYRHFLWSPKGTPLAEDGTPMIAICFGWKASQVSVTPDSHCPFVGVRTPLGPQHDQVRASFLAHGQPPARTLRDTAGYKGAQPWPAYKQVHGPEGWWRDLDGYRETVRTELRNCVEHFGPMVQAVAVAP